jgi:hypothetical protein
MRYAASRPTVALAAFQWWSPHCSGFAAAR